jgi:hypothetical protein
MAGETISRNFEDDPGKVSDELVTQIFIDMWLITGEYGHQVPDYGSQVWIDDDTRRIYETPN